MLAQEESRRTGHNFVGTETILLGLIGEGVGVASKALKIHGVTLKAGREETDKIIGRGSGFVAIEIPFTPRAKRVLELSWNEARELGHNYIGTEHLLLGLIKEGEGVSVRVLENLGVDSHKLRQTVIKLLNEFYKKEEEKKAPELLSETEQELIEDIGKLAVRYSKLVEKLADETGGKPWEPDFHEWAHHVHCLQNAILANAAARAYPDKYRLGGLIKGQEPECGK